MMRITSSEGPPADAALLAKAMVQDFLDAEDDGPTFTPFGATGLSQCWR